MLELQVLHSKAARTILDLPTRASASDALAMLRWKPLLRRRAQHRFITTLKRKHRDKQEFFNNDEDFVIFHPLINNF